MKRDALIAVLATALVLMIVPATALAATWRLQSTHASTSSCESAYYGFWDHHPDVLDHSCSYDASRYRTELHLLWR